MSTPRRNRLRVPLLALAAAITGVLAWRAFHVDLAQQWSVADPPAARALDARNADAAFNLAWRALQEHSADAEARIRAFIDASPADGRGYGLLARLRANQQRDAEARRLFDLALTRAPRDASTRAAYANFLMQLGEVDAAVGQLTEVLRIRPKIARTVHADLINTVDAPGGLDAVANRMRAGAPWTEGFFVDAARQIKDPAKVGVLYEAARSAPDVDVATVRRAWLDRLIAEGRWQQAWLSWAGELDAEQLATLANVNDSGFEGKLTGVGFDWRIGTAPNAQIGVVDGAGYEGTRGLELVFFDGRVPLNQVSQFLLLGPGSHRLTGRVKLESLEGPRGIRWALYCTASSKPLATSEHFLGQGDWRPFSVDVEVPPEQCHAQLLRLETAARAPFEQQLAGRVVFDDIRITRIAAEPAGPSGSLALPSPIVTTPAR